MRVAPPVPPSRVCKCLCLQGEGALRVTGMGMTFVQQELAVKTQLNVAFKLNLQWCDDLFWDTMKFCSLSQKLWKTK